MSTASSSTHINDICERKHRHKLNTQGPATATATARSCRSKNSSAQLSSVRHAGQHPLTFKRPCIHPNLTPSNLPSFWVLHSPSRGPRLQQPHCPMDGQPTLHWWITRQARDKVGRLLDLNDVIALQANSLPCLRKSFPSWGHTYRFTPATSEIIIGCEEKRATGDFLLSSLHLTACPCWLACWWRL